MIACIFSLDYEIYGNGEGSLTELVYNPADRLMALFRERNARFVSFVEAAELEMIELHRTDPSIGLVKGQLRTFYEQGFEIGLHLHPQWYNGRFEAGRWHLDHDEYNLCTLPPERIAAIVDRSIEYLRGVLGENTFNPLSFRAGNWLFQPARAAADILALRGFRVDSSVFKGGLRHEYGLDYRRVPRNGYFWRFSDEATIPDPEGKLIEVPIYTQRVPFWRMVNSKRIGMERKGSSKQTGRQRWNRLRDLLRFLHPLKLDFCRMEIDELTWMMEPVIREDRRDPAIFRPIVAIGHTKELIDFETVGLFLSYLERNRVTISTFRDIGWQFT